MCPVPIWWDRDRDERGNVLRSDVREAAKRIWPRLLHLAKEVLRDPETEARTILEKVVDTISAYLDVRKIPLHDPGGLLTAAFKRELYRLSGEEKKLVNIGDSAELADWLRSSDPASEADQRILFEEIVRILKPRNQAILRLRMAGYEWGEIAKMALFKMNPSTIRNDFWRDVRRAYTEILGPHADLDDPEDEET